MATGWHRPHRMATSPSFPSSSANDRRGWQSTEQRRHLLWHVTECSASHPKRSTHYPTQSVLRLTLTSTSPSIIKKRSELAQNVLVRCRRTPQGRMEMATKRTTAAAELQEDANGSLHHSVKAGVIIICRRSRKKTAWQWEHTDSTGARLDSAFAVQIEKEKCQQGEKCVHSFQCIHRWQTTARESGRHAPWAPQDALVDVQRTAGKANTHSMN